ncbi:MAG TPA: DNA-binding response regulator, partial [Burkholderiales bacterium]
MRYWNGLRFDNIDAVEANASQASILVVDDDPKTLQALQELLQGLAPNIVLANSGEAALRC